MPVKIKVEKIKTPEIGKIASSSKLVLLNELCFIKKIIPTSEGEIRIRIYTPEEGDSFPLLMYFHGGAFFQEI